MKKLELQDPENIIHHIQELFKRNPQARFIHRLDAIMFLAQGHDCYEAARVFNHSPRTLHAWLKAVEEHGIFALQDDPHPGRPSRLTPEIKMILRRDLAEDPRGMGYESPCWTGKLLQSHLKKRYRIDMKIRRCQALLKTFS